MDIIPILLIFSYISLAAIAYSWGYDNGKAKPRDPVTGRFVKDE
jgi:hypothetical protein